VYRRYASLYFVFGVDEDANEFAMLEAIQLFRESLDTLFQGVFSELDVMFKYMALAISPH
jgi:hypothetical protein